MTQKPVSMKAIVGAIVDALDDEREEIQKAFDTVKAKINSRIDEVESRLNAKTDAALLKGAAADQLKAGLESLGELVETPILRKSVLLVEGREALPAIISGALAEKTA